MAHLEHTPLALLLLQMVVVIAASRSLALLAKPLGQPAVIAEVFAGIALGPSLLGWVAPGVMGWIFPPESLPGLQLVSQFGLVLFMFLVGVEFDPRRLSGTTGAWVLISHTSIALPFALGAGLGWGLFDAYAAPGVSRVSFLLFFGVAMSVTAFPVLARILSERGLVGTRVGAIALACAAVDDVTAWCLLALVVGVVKAQGLQEAAVTALLTLAFLAVMAWAVRPLLARIFRPSAADDEGWSPSATVVCLVLLLASAALTEAIGVHALFGAFVFGAVLPKEGGFPAHLATRLELVATSLLLPLFFAWSGLRTELGRLDSPGDWAVAGLVVLVATAGKFGGSVLAGRLTGLGWREASAVGVLMNTRGLMELIVLNVGLDLGVISPTVFTLLVLMALVTTLATSPVLARIYRPEVAQVSMGPRH